jgi:hypothetical protein
MAINRKVLVLLTAGFIGSSLAACHRGEQDKSASSQDSAPMNQAPKQGYTGPANPSTTPPPSSPGAASSSPSDNQMGSPGSTNPSSSQPQPGTANQEQQPQQQK